MPQTDTQPGEDIQPDSGGPEIDPGGTVEAPAGQDESASTVILTGDNTRSAPGDEDRQLLKAVIEAAIYITDEPLTPDQMAAALDQSVQRITDILAELAADYAQPGRGLTIRELAGGYKLGTKPEHHDLIRQFVKRLQPPLKLSLPALETLAVVAYKQPITAPEIMEIRGVQGAGVLKTLLDRKLIATAGRKDVIGKPITYKTTKEFLIQFGLSSLKELPTLKEFEELGRMSLGDEEDVPPESPFVPGVMNRVVDPEHGAPTDADQASAEAEPPAESETKSDG